jgi:hypothetical protein
MQGAQDRTAFCSSKKNRVSTKNIGLLHLNTATTFTRKRDRKKGEQNTGTRDGAEEKLGANDKNRCDQACLNT